ncbi:MAG: RlmE family RNA methyltransferase [Euryarchaeota archaeon]|nr:RlmE family RNA methyltransferase [Euryarchaeota archaeon]
MVRRWVKERRNDAFYRKAKREGYRSRAAYKLLAINERFEIFRPGFCVVDLGAAPGGWSQVAKELVAPDGRVVGVDLQRIDPEEGCVFLRGDVTKPEVEEEVRKAAGASVDVVLSDMSPNISGHYETDHARSVHLAETALLVATRLLRPGGRLVVKVFEGDLFQDYVKLVEAKFSKVRTHRPPATRESSSEIYVIAKRFGLPPQDKPENEE